MRLEVFSDYGRETAVVTDQATPGVIRDTMQSLDWQVFHQVLLSKPNGDWLEVGGSLNPDEGLSVTWEEAGVQGVIAQPPASVAEMTDALLLFLAGKDGWKGNDPRGGAPNPRGKATSQAPESQGSRWATVLLSVIAIGWIAMAVLAARETYYGLASLSWPTTVGSIISSKVVETSDKDEDGHETTSQRAKVEYRYVVGHRVFQAGRISFAGSSDSAHETVRQYYPGSTVSVHYDPTRPDRAVLHPGIGIGLVAIDLFLWGVIGYFLFLWLRGSGRWKRKTSVTRQKD